MTKALSRSTQLPWIMLLLAFVSTMLMLPLTTLKAQDDAALMEPAALYSAEELDNLLAPVALYPDPILAQVLVAATFPEQVELAARYVRINGKYGIDEQPWDISVRAIAHYEPVLNLMADRIDWTTALGQAHVMQAGDVMASVQTLRTMARAQGNLVTTAEQEVVVRDRNIYIVPAQPRVVYVPTYDPLIVYHRPIVHVGVYRSGWSFGVAFPIGVWLTYDVDWHERHVYYHGWRDRGHHYGWYHRSRPYIVVNNIYVNPRRTTVIINRYVVNRRVHYDRFDRYDTVHRRVDWDRRRRVEERRYADRDRRDRGSRGGPSWDRNNQRRGGAAPRRDVARSEPARTPTRTAQPRNQPRTGSASPNRTARPVSQRRTVPRAVPTTSTNQRRAVPTTSTNQRRALPTTSTNQRRVATSPRPDQRRATPSRGTNERRAATPTPRTRSQSPSRTQSQSPSRAQRASAPRASRPAPAPRAREARPSRPSGGKASGSRSSGKSSARTVKARTGKGRQPDR